MGEIFSFVKYLATSNFINFVIMIIFLGWVIKKIDLKTSLNNSIKKVEEAIKNSETKKADSQKRLKLINSAMDKLPQKIKKFDDEMNIRTAALKEKLSENAEETISNIQKNIEKDLVLEEKKISSDLQVFVLEKSIENATEKIKQAIKDNPDLHSKFIEESLEDLYKVNFR